MTYDQSPAPALPKLGLPACRRRVQTRGICALVLAAMLAPALPVSAQSAADKVAAESLFDDGKKLMLQGQYAQACSKLEQSQRIDPGIGTLLYLAECFEKGGRTASAWATFREAASAARAAGQGERARTGQLRADRLEPGLSRLTVNVATENNDIAGLEISRGGAPVSRPLWNIPVPVDPGEHVIEARAPGYKAFSQAIRVGDQGAIAAVRVPPLESDGSAVAPAEPPAQTSTPSAPVADGTVNTTVDTPLEAAADDGSGRRTLALVVGGVGVVGLGVGAFFGLRAMSKNSDAEDLCDGSHCFAEAEDLTDQAKNAALISNIGFGVGAAALIGGAVLYFTAPKAETTTARWQVTPVAGTRGGSLLLRGAF